MTTAYLPEPVANGASTDHPLPWLPFVDDAVLPVAHPAEIERIGRGTGKPGWGRYDQGEQGWWWAFTTDPRDPDYLWYVINAGEHGRSVLLFRGHSGGSIHSALHDTPVVLYRHGGYWWDGHRWYRPHQVPDYATEGYHRRPVPEADTVTAEEILRGDQAQPERGVIWSLGQQPDEVERHQWMHDLALWAAQRSQPCRPLQRCVVDLDAEELRDRVDLFQLAAELEMDVQVVAATWHRQNRFNLPRPQYVYKGLPLWSRAVIQDWHALQQKNPDRLGHVLSRDPRIDSPLQHDIYTRLAQNFTGLLECHPPQNDNELRIRLDELAWEASQTTLDYLPLQQISTALVSTIVQEITQDPPEEALYAPSRSTERLLAWLVRADPSRAPRLFGRILQQTTERATTRPGCSGACAARGTSIRTRCSDFAS